MNYQAALKRIITSLDQRLKGFLLTQNSRKIYSVFFLFATFSLLLFMNRSTFMVADDYIYSFIFTTKERLLSIGDVMESQKLHYMLWGGRLVAHTLLQTILMFPPLVIDILNSMVFVGLLLLMSFHIRGEMKCPSFALIIGVFVAVWIFQPAFSDTLLWITGAVNYLWGTSIILLFLLPYRLHTGQKNSVWLSILLFPLGLVAGCMNENTSIAMIVMALLFILYYRQEFKRIPQWAIAGVAGALIGYVIMVLAPGNYARAEGVTNEPFVLLYRLLTHTQSFVYYLGGLNLLVFIFLLLYIQHEKEKKQILVTCFVYGLGMLTSIYAMVLSPSFPARAWFGPISFNIIVLGILFSNLNSSFSLLRRVKFGVIFCGLVIFGFTLYDAVRDVNQIAQVRKMRDAQIDEARLSGNAVVIEKSVNRTKFGLGDNPNSYVVDYMSAYYGVTIINPEVE